jgi:hypothetical protein
MTFDAKCAKCGAIREFAKLPLKFCCSACGVLNTPQPENTGAGDQACGCLLPEKFEYLLPSGKIGDIRGSLYDKFLTADDGTAISRTEWVEIYGYDPEIVWQNMRKQGKNGIDGYLNLSTLGKKRPK